MALGKTAMVDGVHPGLCIQSTVLKSLDINMDLDSIMDKSHSVKNLGQSKSPFSLFE